jgi:uncharacterized protein YggE
MSYKRLLIAMALLGTLILGAACTQAGDSTPTPDEGTGSPVVGAPAGGGSSAMADYNTFAPQSQAYGTQQSGIWVNGSGRVVVVPDLALLNLGVEASAQTVEQARDQAATAMAEVMAVLTGNGIQMKDIQTQYFNIQPEYVWNDFTKRREITGYRVTNALSVKARDMEGLGALLDRVADAGDDLVRINNISFTTETPEKYSGQAREAAVKDAMSKAQQFAALTGVALGKLIYIAESGSNVPIVRDYAERSLSIESGAAPPTPIVPGEMDVTIYVQAVFGIA